LGFDTKFISMHTTRLPAPETNPSPSLQPNTSTPRSKNLILCRDRMVLLYQLWTRQWRTRSVKYGFWHKLARVQSCRTKNSPTIVFYYELELEPRCSILHKGCDFVWTEWTAPENQRMGISRIVCKSRGPPDRLRSLNCGRAFNSNYIYSNNHSGTLFCLPNFTFCFELRFLHRGDCFRLARWLQPELPPNLMVQHFVSKATPVPAR